MQTKGSWGRWIIGGVLLGLLAETAVFGQETTNRLPRFKSRNGETYMLGKKPYPAGTRDKWIQEGKALARAPEGYFKRTKSLKGAADNRSYLPPIGNQGSEGSCVHWAGTYYTKTANMKRQDPTLNVNLTANQCSPRFTYNLTNAGQDNGGWGHEPFEVFMRYGVPSLAQLPYVAGQYSFLPDMDDFIEGLHRRTANYVWVWEWNPGTTEINELKAWLDAGGVAACAVYAENSFDNWDAGDSPWTGPVCTENDINHMVTVCGYGPGYYLVANSWGTSYGSNGYIVVNSDYFENYFSDVMYPIEGTYEPADSYAKLEIDHGRRSDIRTMSYTVNGTTAWNFSPLPKNLPKDTGSYDTDTRDDWVMAVDLTGAAWSSANTVTVQCADRVSGTVGSISSFAVHYNGGDTSATGTPVSIPDNSAAGASATVAISGSTDTLTIAPAGTNVPAAAASGRQIAVTANVAWTAETGASSTWITITGGSSGSGNGTVTYSVTANSATSSRTGSVVVSGAGITRTHTVVQAGTGVADSLTIAPTGTNVPATASSGRQIAVTANVAWTAVSGTGSTWITITGGSSGSGDGTVTYSVASNSATSSRTGSVVVSGAGITQTLTVVQAGTPGITSLGDAVEAAALIWTTGGDADWFGQTAVSHDGTDAARSGDISNNDGTWMQTTVNGPGTLSFWWRVSSEYRYDYLEFYLDNVLQSGRISGEVSWRQMSYALSAGSHTLQWRYAKDYSVADGSDCGWVDQVTWLPIVSVLEIVPSNTNVPSTASSGRQIAVTANVAWTAVRGANSTWITITGGSSGSGNGAVTYNVAENTATTARTGTVVVSGGDIMRTCTVTQAGAVALLEIAPVSMNVPAGESAGYGIAVTANVAWTAVRGVNSTWITITDGSSGSGDGEVSYSVAENAATTARTGTVVVSGAGITRTCTVVQTGTAAVLEITPASTNVTAASGGYGFAVTANIPWVASPGVDSGWITIVSTSSGNGDALVVYHLDENAATSARTGTVVVSGAGITRTCTVVQAGAVSVLEITPASTIVSAVESTGHEIAVTANMAWTAVRGANSTWITITGGSSGSGDGTVTYNVAENAASTARTGTVIVSGGEITRICTVMQAGSVVVLEITPANTNVPAAATTGHEIDVTANMAWTAVRGANSTWITITGGSSGSGDGTVTYNVTENAATTVRTGTVVVSGGGIMRTFMIVQAGISLITGNVDLDFDGDRISDVAVFRASSGMWNFLYSGGESGSLVFGWSGGVPVPADYDGDGVTDVALYQPAGGTWYIRQSDGKTRTEPFGGRAPIPLADGHAKGQWVDMAHRNEGRIADMEFNFGTGGRQQIRQPNGQTQAEQFGWGATIPLPGDYDGDGMSDLAVFYQATATWYFRYSSQGEDEEDSSVAFGWPAVIPVPADYDGDGVTDIAVYHPTSGNWYCYHSSEDIVDVVPWGWSAAVPVPADYDGDGAADIAVFYRATGTWYIRFSGGGSWVQQWGWSAVVPVAADYDGDGKADLAVYYPAGGKWYIRQSTTGATDIQSLGGTGWAPVLLYPLIHDWFGLP